MQCGGRLPRGSYNPSDESGVVGISTWSGRSGILEITHCLKTIPEMDWNLISFSAMAVRQNNKVADGCWKP
jgi:hypothetical protein